MICNFKLILFGVLCGFAVSAPYYDDEKVYYWRRYNGVIPHNAVKGGKNPQEAPTYIGQVFFEGSVIPTEIRPNQSNVYFIYGAAKSVTDNIKILCSPFPERLEWIKVNERNYKYLWNKHIVIGGYNALNNGPILIGRIFSHGNMALIVGEVLMNDKEIRIYYAIDGAEVSVANTDMELLSFNPYLSIDVPDNIAIPQYTTAVENSAHKSKSLCMEKIIHMNFN